MLYLIFFSANKKFELSSFSLCLIYSPSVVHFVLLGFYIHSKLWTEYSPQVHKYLSYHCLYLCNLGFYSGKCQFLSSAVVVDLFRCLRWFSLLSAHRNGP